MKFLVDYYKNNCVKRIVWSSGVCNVSIILAPPNLEGKVHLAYLIKFKSLSSPIK